MQTTVPASSAAPGNRALFRFILLAAAMYLVWFFGYEQWLGPDGRLDSLMCNHLTKAGVGLLQVLGFDASVDSSLARLVLMNNKPAVIVGPPCNGLVLYALFGGFVLAFPGPWRRKLWFIPAGIALIWCLNVLRVGALAINQYYAHQSVDFNHHYTFTFVVYSFIFGLWMLWARRLATPDRPLTVSI